MSRLSALIIACLLASAPGEAVGCPCDCSGDGTVAVNELITAVGIALGAAPLAGCGAADANDDAAVSIAELIAGVNAALASCPADPDALPAAALALVRAAAQMHALVEPVAMGFSGAVYGPGECEGGGEIDVACEASGGAARVTVSGMPCVERTAEGLHRHTGTVVAISEGQCPGPPSFGTMRFAVDLRTVTEGDAGPPALTIDHAQESRLGPLFLGSRPCEIKGGTAITTGAVAFSFADGRRVSTTLDATSVAARFFDFIDNFESCNPARIETTLAGPLAVGLAAGTVAATLDVTATVELVARRVTLAGTATLADGTTLTLATPEPLGFPLGASCFTAGTLAITAGETQTVLRFPGDGSVAIDRDADGTTDRIDLECL